MKLYRIPKWCRRFYPGAIWDFSFHKSKDIYLTFDDGPHPELTEYLLELLAEYDAKATFFCIGAKVKEQPELYKKMIEGGHAVGNHSMTHPNGWKTGLEEYLQNVENASEYIPSKLFRAPYGKLKLSQFKSLKKLGYKVVFWSVVSFDFNPAERSDTFVNRMIRYTKPGSIFVFHDNPKAIPILKDELPRLLDYWKSNDYTFKTVLEE